MTKCEKQLFHALEDMLYLIDCQQPGVMKIPGHSCGVEELPSYQRAASLVVAENAATDAVDCTMDKIELLVHRETSIGVEAVSGS